MNKDKSKKPHMCISFILFLCTSTNRKYSVKHIQSSLFFHFCKLNLQQKLITNFNFFSAFGEHNTQQAHSFPTDHFNDINIGYLCKVQ